MVEIKITLLGDEPKALVDNMLLGINAVNESQRNLIVKRQAQTDQVSRACSMPPQMDIKTAEDGDIPELVKPTEAPARKRRTKKEIEQEKAAKLNAELAETEGDDAEDSDDDGESIDGLFDIPDDDDDDDAEDSDDDETPKVLDTKDPKHMTVIAELYTELVDANKKNKQKISDILEKKIKKSNVKTLSDKDKKLFYAELLKLKN